jgi:sarcosine oxidase, subunit gamma
MRLPSTSPTCGLEGEGIREVLIKGTSLDLLGSDYPPGTVRRAKVAELAALIHIVEDTIIDLYVFRSYADHLWDFLLKAANPAARVKLFAARTETP